MFADTFTNTMFPIWLAEAGVFFLYALFSPSDAINPALLISGSVSLVLLPSIAGFRLQQAGVGRPTAVLGAMSISLVGAACALISFAIDGPGWLVPYLGYLIATLFVSVPAQALSGFVAASFAARWSHET